MTFDTFFDQPKFDYDYNKKLLIENLEFLKNQTVEESVFYKKHQEVQDYSKFLSKSLEVKSKIWIPTDINNEQITIEEIENLNPEVVFVKTQDDEMDWLMIRVFCHTMSFDQTPGRFLKFLIKDKNTQKILGAISLSSDVLSITCRDQYIGWTETQRVAEKRISQSSIGSCIMSTQPFGYNFLGGKLVACLTTSSIVQNKWKELYNQTLVGVTTTSLYGSKSMYNGIPYWHKCGSSSGKIFLKPDEKFYNIWHDYIKEHRNEEYTKKMTQKEGVSGPVTGAKMRVMQMIFSELKISASKYCHGFERGVYYAPIYENTKEFLRGEITEDKLIKKPKFVEDIDGMITWWKSKAINRYKSLKTENRLKPDVLYYNSMIGSDYQTCKAKFFNEVGR